jgi:hypothetical protein
MKAVLLLLLLLALTSATATNLLRGRSDPKTVETKKRDDLRYLFFGTSRTYGSALKNVMKERFSYLMSPDSTNVEIPDGMSPYPARCCYTMVGKSEIYDVIVLEWMPVYFETTFEFAKRLHKRFPNATLSFWISGP